LNYQASGEEYAQYGKASRGDAGGRFDMITLEQPRLILPEEGINLREAATAATL